MIVHAFFPILAAIYFLAVAFFVYSKQKTDRGVRRFVLMLICVSLWNIDLAGIRAAPYAEFAELWGKIFRIGLLFIPPTFLHFALVYSNPKGMPSPQRLVLIASYCGSIFFSIINWTPYFTRDAKLYSFGYSVQSGPVYPYFIGMFLFCVFLAITFILRNYFRVDSYQRHQIKYFFLAMSIGFIIGSMNFLPMLGVEIYPFGTIAIIVSLSVMSYSIVKHRLMDVSVFMSKGLGYVLSIAILGVPAIVGIVFLERYFFQQEDLSFSLILLAIGIVVALSFNKVKERMDRAMRLIIVKDKYFYHRILEEFSRRLVTMVDLNRLLQMLADTVERSMGVWRISVFLYSQEKEVFHPALVRGSPEMGVKDISFRSDDRWIRYLLEKKEGILRVELGRNPENPEKEELFPVMERLQAEVCLPLIYLDRIIGFINLGHKTGEEMYYREDLDLLNSLANQVAIAIETANLYENLKKSQNIMRRADRLASLGTLIASLAHEIRNPLVSIKTFTQLLPERLEDEEFRNYFLKIASGEIDRLTTLINELLGFARPSEPNLQGEDVNALIDKMEFLIATEARKKNIAISKYYAPNLPAVMVDAEQIKQVLLNILLNAIQAISGGGQIWVETRVVRVPREETTERFVQIEVRDSGAGIPKENMERVFDPFFSTRPEGSGLGLAISHQIIHEHGGFIDLESELGKGTSFRIHLPLKNGRRGGPGN